MSDEDTIRAAARVLMTAALDLLQADPHLWSDRGCQTCCSIGAIVGRPFGCYAYMQRKKAP